MEITSVQRDGVNVVSLAGELGMTASADATAYLTAKIEEGRSNLLIDVSGLTYLSSAGLSAILGAMRDARSAGGDVRLAGAEGDIRRVVDMAGIAQVMKIFGTVDEAIESYAS
jgi:anti-sigma B factor antagonist